MSNISIKKAKLHDNLFLLVEFDEHLVNNVTNKIKRESTAPVHQDLVRAFKLLDPHLAFICYEITQDEFIKAIEPNKEAAVIVSLVDPKSKKSRKLNLFNEEEKEPNPEDAFKVTGFSIGGSGDSEGVTLIGRRELPNGKIKNIISPFTKWLDDKYSHGSELAQVIEECKYEIKEFIVNGKQAPDRQQEIDFPGDEDETQPDSDFEPAEY